MKLEAAPKTAEPGKKKMASSDFLDNGICDALWIGLAKTEPTLGNEDFYFYHFQKSGDFFFLKDRKKRIGNIVCSWTYS